jgi:PPK2 family polyphosphate:nucleotide phosphotransferase
MKRKDFLKQAGELAQRFRVVKGADFRLKKVDPDETGGIKSEGKATAEETLADSVQLLAEFQSTLYAQDCWTVLLIFQAMDAAGKDSAIKHVMSGVNPQGCQVHSFKVPSAEDLDHDFLWRCTKRLPERGCIGIFNRSYYEETLAVRVHREFLQRQKLPPKLVTNDIWSERFEDIRNFEHHLSRNGVVILKFFLHVSKDEQKKRFLERIDNAEKNWKFSLNDVHERQHWAEYMSAYEETIRHTATEYAPWYVVPADHKWFTRLVVSSALIDCLASLNLKYPTLRKKERKDLEDAKQTLLSEG